MFDEDEDFVSCNVDDIENKMDEKSAFETEMEGEADLRFESVKRELGILELAYVENRLQEQMLLNTRKTSSTLRKSQRRGGCKGSDSSDLSSDDDHVNNLKETTSTNKEKIGKSEVLTNSDAFYDPDMDEKDQQWVDKQMDNGRMADRTADVVLNSKKQKSDATLNCAACFTLVCLDCQRHEIYENQYRAMFVKNVRVGQAPSDHVVYKEKKDRRTSKSKKPDRDEITCDEDKFLKVYCEKCESEVGVFDHEEVYHFYNVISTNCS